MHDGGTPFENKQSVTDAEKGTNTYERLTIGSWAHELERLKAGMRFDRRRRRERFLLMLAAFVVFSGLVAIWVAFFFELRGELAGATKLLIERHAILTGVTLTPVLGPRVLDKWRGG